MRIWPAFLVAHALGADAFVTHPRLHRPALHALHGAAASWAELEAQLPSSVAPEPRVIDSVLDASQPTLDRLTLFRERNGWCGGGRADDDAFRVLSFLGPLAARRCVWERASPRSLTHALASSSHACASRACMCRRARAGAPTRSACGSLWS